MNNVLELIITLVCIIVASVIGGKYYEFLVTINIPTIVALIMFVGYIMGISFVIVDFRYWLRGL